MESCTVVTVDFVNANDTEDIGGEDQDFVVSNHADLKNSVFKGKQDDHVQDEGYTKWQRMPGNKVRNNHSFRGDEMVIAQFEISYSAVGIEVG
jgi:hypothetical protein